MMGTKEVYFADLLDRDHLILLVTVDRKTGGVVAAVL